MEELPRKPSVDAYRFEVIYYYEISIVYSEEQLPWEDSDQRPRETHPETRADQLPSTNATYEAIISGRLVENSGGGQNTWRAEPKPTDRQ